jgi:hypothetical protein
MPKIMTMTPRRRELTASQKVGQGEGVVKRMKTTEVTAADRKRAIYAQLVKKTKDKYKAIAAKRGIGLR